MARQYLSVPSGSVNFTEALTKSLFGLSKTLSDAADEEASQEQIKLDRADALARDAENKRRFDLQEARQQALADRQQQEYENKLGAQNFYKSLSQDFNINDVAAEKAKRIFGVTDEQLSGDKGEAILSLVKDKGLFQEDVDNYLNRKYTSQYGPGFDPVAARPYYGSLSSLASLQEQENASAKLAAEFAKEARGDQIQALKALVPKSVSNSYDAKGNYTDRNGAKRKTTSSYAELLTAPLVKEFEDNSWWNFTDSEREEAKKIADNLVAFSKNSENEISPFEAEIAIKATLDRLKEGGKLTSIDDSSELAIATFGEALNDFRKAQSYSNKVNPARQALLDFGLGKNVESYTPTNIRTKRINEVKTQLDKILGRTSTPISNNSNTPSSNNASTPITNNIEERISNDLGIGPKPSVINQTIENPNTILANTTSSNNTSVVGTPTENTTNTLNNQKKKPSVSEREEILRGVIPSSAISDKGITELSSFFDKKPSVDDVQTLAEGYNIPPRTLLNVYDQYLENTGKVGPKRQARIDRYKEGEQLVDSINEKYGDRAIFSDTLIDNDTLFILPYDKEGRNKDWSKVVSEINNHPSVNLFNTISRDEYLKAQNNPAVQQEIIDKANRLIATDFRERTATERMQANITDTLGSLVGNTADSIAEFFSGVNPDSEEFKQSEQEKINRLNELKQELEYLKSIDSFIHKNQGTVDLGGSDLGKSFGAFWDNAGDNTNTQVLTSLAGAGLGAPLAVKGATKLLQRPIAAKTFSGASKLWEKVPKFRRKGPEVVTKDVPPRPSDIIRPTKDMYWKNFERPTNERIKIDDAIRLRQWLQRNANPKPKPRF